MEKERYMRVKDDYRIPEHLRGKVGIVTEEQHGSVTLAFGFFMRVLSTFPRSEVEDWTLAIEEGNIDGQYFNLAKFVRLKKLAVDIARMQPAATNFKVWYDAHSDYHHLSFDLNSHHYDLRYYKVFCLTKDFRDNFLLEKNFNIRDDKIVEMFEKNQQEQWDVTVGIYNVKLGKDWISTLYAHSQADAERQAALKHQQPYTVTCTLEPKNANPG